MKTKQIVIGLVVLVVVIGLLTIGRFTGTTVTGFWKDTEIRCLVQGHQNLTKHIHSRLSIVENGAPIFLVSNIGISGTCFSELHTHDASGTIHIESTDPDKLFFLTDFLAVWGEPLKRDGVLPTISINGEIVSDVEEVVFTDGADIRLIYGSTGEEELDTEEVVEE